MVRDSLTSPAPPALAAVALGPLRAVAFFDDSFAVGRRRVHELADHLADLGLGWTWTAHLGGDVLSAMRRAGCGGVDIDRVLAVVRACRERDLHGVVNLMFGWPNETARELDNALRFLDLAAEAGAWFNARAVLVPFPGTAKYDRQAQEFGFDQWWLRDPPMRWAQFPQVWNHAEMVRGLAGCRCCAGAQLFCRGDAHLRRIQGALDWNASANVLFGVEAGAFCPASKPRRPSYGLQSSTYSTDLTPGGRFPGSG